MRRTKRILLFAVITMLAMVSIFVLTACGGNDSDDDYHFTLAFNVPSDATVVGGTRNFNYGDIIEDLPTIERVGYVFVEWFVRTINTQTQITTDRPFRIGMTVNRVNFPNLPTQESLEDFESTTIITLRARFTPTKIQLEFILCENSFRPDGAEELTPIEYGDIIQSQFMGMPSRRGFVFRGFFDTQQGDGRMFINEVGFWNPSLPRTINSDNFPDITSRLRLYARFSLNNFFRQGMNAVYGTTLDDIENGLPDGWEWKYPNNLVGNVSPDWQLHEVHYTGSSATERVYYVGIEVLPAVPNIATPPPRNALRGQRLSEISLPRVPNSEGRWEWEDPTLEVTATGQFWAIFHPGNSNFRTVRAQVTVNIVNIL